MQFAPLKCVYVGPATEEQCAMHLKLYGVGIPKEPESVKYLGLCFDDTGLDMNKCIEERTGKAKQVAGMLGDIGMNPTAWTYRASTLAYKAFIRPTMEYGIALLLLSKAQVKPLTAVHNASMRRTLGAPCNTFVSAMSKLLLIEDMTTRMERNQRNG